MTGSRCMIDCITTANTTTTLAFHGFSFFAVGAHRVVALSLNMAFVQHGIA